MNLKKILSGKGRINIKYFDFSLLTLTKILGNGTFGSVFLGQFANRQFAVKFVAEDEANKIEMEKKVLEKIHEDGQKKTFPFLYKVIRSSGGYSMVMSKLNMNILDLCQIHFSDEDVLHWGLNILDRLEILHDKGFIHRDIKRDNIVVGPKQIGYQIILIDFGCSKQIIFDGHHIEQKDQGVYGHDYYLSLHSHHYRTQSRRDDIQSLGYLLIELILDKLPWSHIHKGPGHRERIKELKEDFSLDFCSQFSEYEELFDFIIRARVLDFEERPNYQLFRNLLNSIINRKFTAHYNPTWIGKAQVENYGQFLLSPLSMGNLVVKNPKQMLSSLLIQ